MSKHIELAKKLKALADRGIDGEKQTAEKMLADLLKKHKITIEEIEGEKTEDYYFTFKDKSHRLWFQIVKTVNTTIKCYGPFPAGKVKQYALKGNYMIICTPCEYIEIEAKYNFYKNLYDQEMNIFYAAFLRANDLLVVNNRSDNQKEMSFVGYEKYNRINDLAQSIKKGEFLKQITK
jgi:hypothetical protein